MQQFIGCDAHKRFSVFVAVDEHGNATRPIRIEHRREAYAHFLNQLPPGSEIAVESTGHWYWLVDAMEGAGHHVHLANPMETKKRLVSLPTAPCQAWARSRHRGRGSPSSRSQLLDSAQTGRLSSPAAKTISSRDG